MVCLGLEPRAAGWKTHKCYMQNFLIGGFKPLLLWSQKRLLFQLFHSHCPMMQTYLVPQILHQSLAVT